MELNEEICSALVSPSDKSISPDFHGELRELCVKLTRINVVNFFRISLIKYTYPILFGFGIIGNIVSLFLIIKTYRSKRKENRNFLFCLSIVCCSDMSVLIFGCFREYLEEVFGYHLRSANIYTCKILYFAVYFFNSFSSYIYAFIAIDRWYAVANPFSYNLSRWKKNRRLILGLLVYCILISLPFFVNSSLVEEIVHDQKNPVVQLGLVCAQSFESSKVVSILDSILNCILPFLITVLFSLMTLMKLMRNKNLNKYKMVLGTSCPPSKFSMTKNKESIGMSIINNLTLIMVQRDSLTKRSSSLKCMKSEIMIEKNLRKNKSLPIISDPEEQLTYRLEETPLSSSNDCSVPTVRVYSQKSSKLKITFMLLVFPISFLLTSFPIFLIIIFRMFDLYFKLEIDLAIFLSIAKVLMFLNNSINIVLLIIFGKNIRNDFLKIFCKKRRNNI